MSRNYGVQANAVSSITDHPEFGQNSQNEKDLFQGLDSKLPAMPGELGQIAQGHWIKIGKRLERAGLISSVDLSVLRVYCETYEHYVLAQREIKDAGTEFQSTPNGYLQLSPAAIARERHASRLHKLEQKLFLTPHARQSLKIENPNQASLDLD